MAGHLRLNFHLVEGLAIVDAHRAARHPRQDNHVAQVCLHTWGVSVAAPPSWLPAGTSAAMLLAPEAAVPGQQLTAVLSPRSRATRRWGAVVGLGGRLCVTQCDK